ncbi:MAG: PAS domain S-box protein, partial [Cyanobacteriota bacterium]
KVRVIEESEFKKILEHLSNFSLMIAKMGESKKKEEEKNAYLNSLFEGIDADIYVCNDKYEIEYANNNFRKRFKNFKPGIKCHDIIFETPEECSFCKITEALNTNKICSQDLLIVNDNQWNHVTYSPIKIYSKQKHCMVIMQDITERKNNETDLLNAHNQLLESINIIEESEEKYRSLFSHMTEAVFIGRVVFDDSRKPITIDCLDFNKAFEFVMSSTNKILTRDEICNSKYLRLFENYLDVISNVIDTNNSICFDKHIEYLDKYLRISIAPLKKDRFAAIITDVTFQIKAEDELRITKLSVDSSTAMTAWLDIDGNFIKVNKALIDNLGYSEEELLTMSVFDIDYNLIKDEWHNSIESLKKEHTIKFETINKRKDGTIFPILVTANYIKYKDKEYIFSFTIDISELKKAQQEFLEAHNALEAITETAVDAIILIDNEGKVINWNKSAENIFGYTKQEILHQNLHNLIVPERYMEAHKKGFAHFIKSGEGNAVGKTVELSAIRKDGTEIIVELSLSSLKIQNKWHAVGIARDITERKASEEKLNLSQFIIDHSSAPTFLINYNGNIEYANDNACKWLGYSKDDFYKLSVFDLNPNRNPDNWNKALNDLKENNNVVLDTVLIKKDNSTVPVQININHFVYDNKTYICSYIIDLSERKKFETKILEANKTLETITETAVDAIILINSEGNIVYWSNAAEKIFGYSREEIIGKSLHKTLAPERFIDAYKKGMQHFKHTGEGGAVGKIVELTGIRKDSTEFPFELSLQAIKLKNEWHAVGIVRDITDRKELENQLAKERDNLEITVKERTKDLQQSLLKLQEALSHKDRFLATISHELRTPLNGIIGYTDMLGLKYFGSLNEKQDEYISIIGNSSKHLLSLINDLLDLTMVDSGSMTLELEDINIQETINEIISIMKSQFKNKNISLKANFITNQTNIQADQKKLRQILLNLLSNSHKFTNEGGNVQVIVENSIDLKIKISVKDNGIGIKKEDQKKIFDEFFKTDYSTNQAIGGTGIGLALTKRLVEMHKGIIYVDSEPGTGTTISFDL